MNGVQTELNLPMNLPVPGSELTKEPFRWDQRLFSLVLRMPGSVPNESILPVFIPPADDSPIDAMCEVTGGRSYLITAQRQLHQCLESLVSKVQPGVVINFEKIGPDPTNLNGDDTHLDPHSIMDDKQRVLTPTPVPSSSAAWHSCRKLIYVPRSAQKGYAIGHWPIPEAYWPDPNCNALPARSAHPSVKFSCVPCEPMVLENLPFDKYELEPSPLTQYILERRQPNVAWQIFLANSGKFNEMGHPFGYLKASSNLSTVNMFVMPYNYPVLIPLLEELLKDLKWKPNPDWRQRFENYLKSMPVYYATPLKRALTKMGAPTLVPDNLDNSLSYSVISYLKKLRNQAKLDYDNLVNSVGQKPPTIEGIQVIQRKNASILQRKDFINVIKNLGNLSGNFAAFKREMNEFNGYVLRVPDKTLQPQYFRNPFDIPRKRLLDQISRMRANFLQSSDAKLADEDNRHSVPVGQMGNYQDYLKRQTSPLRELEMTPVRQHMFGNPFKVNKNIMIDEADEAMPGSSPRSSKRPASPQETPPGSPGPKKRKPGPLPKNIPYRRPSIPPLSPNGFVTSEYTVPPSPTPAEPPPEDMIENNLSDSTNESHSDTDDEWSSDLVIDIDKNHEKNVHLNHNKVNNHSVKKSPDLDNYFTLRKAAIKEVRKPGRDYENLFNKLASVPGSVETRCNFVREIMHEAARFKKQVLLQQLGQYEKKLVINESKNKDKPVNNTHISPPR